MNILFVSIAWPKEGQRNLYTDLVESLNGKGHKVSVLTICEKRDGNVTIKSDQDGMKILRVATGNITKTTSVKKGLNLIMLNHKLYFGIKKHYKDESFDLIIATTPPITLSGLLNRLKKLYGAGLYLLLKDIWPQGSVDLGVINKGGVIWRFFRYHEKKLYRLSDYIGCMSRANVEYLLQKNSFLSEKKVEECPNSIIPYHSGSLDEEARNRLNIPQDATVFLFSGNLGLGHGLGFYYDCILKLQDFKKAYFLIGGAGTHYKYLEEKIKNDKPSNLMLYSWLPENDFRQILLLSDIGVILLRNSYSTPQFPSRLLAYLNRPMPVFCVVNKQTDIGEIIEDYGAGLSITHGDSAEFIETVKKICTLSDTEKKEMGENANSLLMERYTADKSAEIILNHFVKNRLNAQELQNVR